MDVGLPLPGGGCAVTPGLAGFVAADTATQTCDEVIASVLAALGQEFTVVPDRRGAPVGARRRTWLDTFDWRLYRAGLILEYAAAHRGRELRLTSAHPAALSPEAAGTAAPTDPDGAVAQPVTGWQASRPHLPEDLP